MRSAQLVSNESRRSVGNLLESESSNYMQQSQNYQHNSRNSGNPIYGNDNQYDDVVLRNHHNNYNHFKSSDNITKNSPSSFTTLQTPKYTDVWVQQYQQHQKYFDQHQQPPPSIHNNSNNSNSQSKSYNNKHWLIQEAEQRRIDQHRTNFNRHSMSDALIQSSSSPSDSYYKQFNTTTGSGNDNSNSSHNSSINSNSKPLPDSVIQTLTQRVYSRGIGERKTLPNLNQKSSNLNSDILSPNQNENILSVSGKKKCSHCKDELGKKILKLSTILVSQQVYKCINNFRSWSSDDNRKSSIILPYRMFQMFSMSCTTW